MSLNSYMENLRARPEHIRKRHAFWYSFCFTAILALFWLSSFPVAGTAIQGSVTSAVNKVSSPGQSLVAGVADFANNVWSMIVGPKKVEYAVVEVLPGRK